MIDAELTEQALSLIIHGVPTEMQPCFRCKRVGNEGTRESVEQGIANQSGKKIREDGSADSASPGRGSPIRYDNIGEIMDVEK